MFPSQSKAERLALTATYALLGAGVAATGFLAGLQHLLTRKPRRHLAEMSNAEIDATVPEPRDAHVRMARLARMSPDAYDKAYREWGQLDA